MVLEKQRKGNISGRRGAAVSKAAEIANEIWAETSLLVTHKSNFCDVVKAKTRLKKVEE